MTLSARVTAFTAGGGTIAHPPGERVFAARQLLHAHPQAADDQQADQSEQSDHAAARKVWAAAKQGEAAARAPEGMVDDAFLICVKLTDSFRPASWPCRVVEQGNGAWTILLSWRPLATLRSATAWSFLAGTTAAAEQCRSTCSGYAPHVPSGRWPSMMRGRPRLSSCPPAEIMPLLLEHRTNHWVEQRLRFSGESSPSLRAMGFCRRAASRCRIDHSR